MLGTDLLNEELKMLVRASRNERFRFIIIQYNHFSLTDRVKQTLENAYPKRTFNSINIEETPKEDFINSLLNFEKGFVFIYEFEKLLEENYRSLAIGFNQRRDKFSDHPITLIAFLPWGENYLHQFQKTMPDFFSLANPIIQLKKEIISEVKINFNSNQMENNFKDSDEAINEIKEIERRLKTLEKIPENINLFYNLNRRLGSAYYFVGNYQKALKIISKIINSKDKSFYTQNQISILLNDIGVIYSNLGNYKKALTSYKKALDIRIKNENKNELSTLYNNIGENYQKLNKPKKGLEFLLKGLDLSKSANGDFSYNTGIIYSNLGLVYEDLGEFEKAKECFNKDLNFTLIYYGKLSPYTAICYNNLGSICVKQKEYNKALEYNNKALDIRLKTFNKNHPEIANSYNNIGAVYSFIGDFKKAINYYEKSYEILSNVLGKNHPDSIFVYENILSLKK